METVIKRIVSLLGEAPEFKNLISGEVVAGSNAAFTDIILRDQDGVPKLQDYGIFII